MCEDLGRRSSSWCKRQQWRRLEEATKNNNNNGEADPAGLAAAAAGLTTLSTRPPFMATVQPWAVTVLWLPAKNLLNGCLPEQNDTMHCGWQLRRLSFREQEILVSKENHVMVKLRAHGDYVIPRGLT